MNKTQNDKQFFNKVVSRTTFDDGDVFICSWGV